MPKKLNLFNSLKKNVHEYHIHYVGFFSQLKWIVKFRNNEYSSKFKQTSLWWIKIEYLYLVVIEWKMFENDSKMICCGRAKHLLWSNQLVLHGWCIAAKAVGRICVINKILNCLKYFSDVFESKLIPPTLDLIHNNETLIFRQHFA